MPIFHVVFCTSYILQCRFFPPFWNAVIAEEHSQHVAARSEAQALPSLAGVCRHIFACSTQASVFPSLFWCQRYCHYFDVQNSPEEKRPRESAESSDEETEEAVRRSCLALCDVGVERSFRPRPPMISLQCEQAPTHLVIMGTKNEPETLPSSTLKHVHREQTPPGR